jgi:hypothetical protein
VTRGLFAALLAISIAGFGCAGQVGPAAGASGAGLPKWDTHDREVFDDALDPAAVGLQMEGPSPRSDRFLRERSQLAEVVGYMRVSTVTVDTIGDGAKRVHVGVEVAQPTLAKPRIEEKSFELSLGSGSSVLPAGFESRLRGRTFIGFVRRYATDEGESVVHWHLSANSPEVAAAVKEAVALQEFARP